MIFRCSCGRMKTVHEMQKIFLDWTFELSCICGAVYRFTVEMKSEPKDLTPAPSGMVEDLPDQTGKPVPAEVA